MKCYFRISPLNIKLPFSTLNNPIFCYLRHNLKYYWRDIVENHYYEAIIEECKRRMIINIFAIIIFVALILEFEDAKQFIFENAKIPREWLVKGGVWYISIEQHAD